MNENTSLTVTAHADGWVDVWQHNKRRRTLTRIWSARNIPIGKVIRTLHDAGHGHVDVYTGAGV